MTVTFATHEQGMGCLNCGLAGFVGEEHFPQEPGVWERPCPDCGMRTVWVTEPRERATAEEAPRQ